MTKKSIKKFLTQEKRNDQIVEIKNGCNVSLKLPSDFKQMENYIQHNKVRLMESVLNAIEHALLNKQEMVEVFSFDNSKFVITLSKQEYAPAVDDIYKKYLTWEKYELCSRIVKIKKMLSDS